MSLQVILDGKPIDATAINVHADHIAGTSGTFSIDPSVIIKPGDPIYVTYNGKTLAAGIVSSTIRHASGSPTSASFISGHTLGRAWPEERQALWPEDQKIIDNFLIDSFARGFAKGG